MKYIPADKLIAEIEKRKKSIDECPFIEAEFGASIKRDVKIKTFDELISLITSLQQVQPEDKQIVIITESHGDANIEWDCRSLDDVIALLKSAETFITEKQIEKMVGPRRSGPDYATIEGRYSRLFKRQQKQPEPSNNLVDADAVREDFITQVYRVLDTDPTNDRANAIIDAFDSLPTVSQVQPEVDLEKSRNLIRASLNGVTRLGSLCDDQTIEHAVDNIIDELGLNARKEE